MAIKEESKRGEMRNFVGTIKGGIHSEQIKSRAVGGLDRDTQRVPDITVTLELVKNLQQHLQILTSVR